jgi:hypothetical protein
MRALCAAIITAGSLIGLGLTALGIGTRYSNFHRDLDDTTVAFVRFKAMDTPLQFCLVFLAIAAIIGVATTFVGLAYHHERRQREHELMAKGHPVHRAGV